MARKIEIAYYLLYGLFYAGFWFSESDSQDIGPYSSKYFLFLITLSIGLLLPQAVKFLVLHYDVKTIMFSLIPMGIILFIIYVGASLFYYYTQNHFFDPFLQAHPRSVDPRRIATSQHAFRVLALGGSTTQNKRLPTSARYPKNVEVLLQKEYPNFQVDVVNAGVDWYTTKHSLINYVTNLEEWRPQVTIIMHAVNDLLRSCTPRRFAIATYDRQWSHYYGPASKGAMPLTFEQHIFDTRLTTYWTKWFETFRKPNEIDFPLEHYRSLPDFERYLGSLVHYLIQDGVRVVLVTQPYLYKEVLSRAERNTLWFGKVFCLDRESGFVSSYPSPGSLELAMNAFNGVTRKVAAQYGAILVDAESEVPKDLDHFVDDVHYTARGARRIAELVASAIIGAELVPEWSSQ